MAAYRYITELIDELGNDWDVRLWDESFVGAPTDLGNMPQPGFNISFKAEGDKLFTAVKASECKCKFFVRDSTQETFWRGIVSLPENSLYLTIIKNGSLHWQGPILNDLANYDHASFPLEIEVTATDGLGILDGLVFDSTSWGNTIAPGGIPKAVFSGTDLIADIIAKIYPGGIPIDSVGTNDIFTTAAIVGEANMGSGDIIANTGFVFNQFKLEQKEAADGQEYMYYRQVLEEVCKSLGLRVFYSEGYFRFVQVVQQKYYDNTIEYLYDIDAVEVSNQTYDASVTSTVADWDAEPLEGFAAPIKKIILPAKANNNLLGGDTGGGLVYEAVSTKFTTWVPSIPVLYFDFTSVLQPTFTGGAGKKLTVSMDIDINNDGSLTNSQKVQLMYFKLLIKDAGGNWYALSNYDATSDSNFQSNPMGERPLNWVASSAPAVATKLLYQQFHTDKNAYHVEFSTPDLPFDVVDSYFLVGWSGFNTGLFDGNFTNGSAIVNAVTNFNSIVATAAAGGVVFLGTGIPANTTLVGSNSPARITLSNNFTGSTGRKTGMKFYSPTGTLAITDNTILTITNARVDWNDGGTQFADKGVVYTAESNLKASQVWEEDLYNIADFTGGNAKECVQYWDGAAWQLATEWKILPAYEVNTAYALLHTLVLWMLRFHRKSLMTFAGSLQHSTFNPHLVIEYTYGSTTISMVFIGGTFEASTCSWSGEWVIVNTSAAADVSVDQPAKNYILDNLPKVNSPWIFEDIALKGNQIGNIGTAVSSLGGALAATAKRVEVVYDTLAMVSYNLTGAPTANARVNDINFTLDTATMQWFDGTTWQTGFQALTTTLPDGQIWIGNGSNVATGRTLTGDVTVSDTGVTAIGTAKVVDAMLATSYIKADGSRALTANWAAGAFSATFNSVIVGQAANAIAGGAASGGDFTLKSTSHATKGKIYLGTATYYDEVNDRIINGTSATYAAASGNPIDINISKSVAAGNVGMSITNIQTDGVTVLTMGQSSTNRGLVAFFGSTQTTNTYSQNASLLVKNVLRLQNPTTATGADIHIIVANGGTTGTSAIIGITGSGSTSGAICFRQDISGFRIDGIAAINTVNNTSNYLTVNGKSYFGGNSAATAHVHIQASTASIPALTIADGATSTSNLTGASLFNDSTDLRLANRGFALHTVGSNLKIKEGTNAIMGVATLVAGTVVVNTTKVTANSRIFLDNNTNGGTIGFLSVSARTAATSFTITSSNALDTSVIAWVILEPA